MNYPSVVGAFRVRAIGQCNSAACGPLAVLTFAIKNSPISTATPSRLNEMSSASLVPIQRLSARSVLMIGGGFNRNSHSHVIKFCGQPKAEDRRMEVWPFGILPRARSDARVKDAAGTAERREASRSVLDAGVSGGQRIRTRC